ncbi:hypothetical protein [Proteus terrae]|uniref:tail fiber/spike domain-containing protein n=1 Tax=Proteus terrae TaxID=1574161 RepID=UPI00301C4F55
MTVSTELSHEEYVGNGVTTDFDFRFRIFESKHLIVVVADSDGNETTLKNGTDYTIVGAGSYHGGKVVLNKPLARGWKILLERDLPVVQETDLRNQGKFFAEVHEDAFDYLTMLIQKALGTFSLSLRKPTYLSNYYDAKGNRIANLAPPKSGSDSANKDYVDNSIKYIDSKTLRVKDKAIPALPSAEQRRNKQLGFDNEGYPQLLDPAETGSLGYVLVDSFEKGAEITTRYQALHFENNGEYYRWDGDLPKSVPVNSSPVNSGGIGVGKWISVGDASLRGDLGEIVKKFNNVNVMKSKNDLSPGMLVATLGFHSKSSGGGATYLIVSPSDYNGTPDGYSDHLLNNGNIAVLQLDACAPISKFGALFVNDVDCAPCLQSAINKTAGLGKSVVIDGNCRLGKSVNIKSGTTINADSAKIKVASGIGNLFNAKTNGAGIESVSIIGGEWTEDSQYDSGTVTFCNMQGEYGSGEGFHVYVNRFNLQRVKLYNFNWFLQSDWGRSWNIDNCFFYGRNGLRLQHKNVECNITNSIIFGTNPTSSETRGISIGERLSYANEGRYPEGIKIHNCTIDNFGRALSIHEVLDLSVTDNWLGASIDRTKYCLVFERDSGNFMSGLHFNHNTYFGGKIEFTSHSSPPTQAFIQMSDEIYLTSKTLVIGRSWHDIVMSDWVFQNTSSNSIVGISGSGDNQRCHFKNLTFKGAHSGLIQLNSNTSFGCEVSDIWCDTYVEDPFYTPTPTYISNSMGGKAIEGGKYNGGQVISFKKAQSAIQGNIIVSFDDIGFRIGALVEVSISGVFKSSLDNGALFITDESKSLVSFAKGTGWDSAYIGLTNYNQRIDAKVVFKCVKPDLTSVKVTSLTGDTVASFHPVVTLRYI